MTATTTPAEEPRAELTVLTLYRAAEMLADLLRRSFQHERVVRDALSRDDGDPLLDVHGARQAVTIFGEDVDRIAQAAIDAGFLDTAGDVAIAVALAEPSAT